MSPHALKTSKNGGFDPGVACRDRHRANPIQGYVERSAFDCQQRARAIRIRPPKRRRHLIERLSAVPGEVLECKPSDPHLQIQCCKAVRSTPVL